MANYKLEQFSSTVDEYSNLVNNIFDEFFQIWNSQTGRKSVSKYRLLRGPNGEFATFTPDLKDSDEVKVFGYFQENDYYGKIFLSETLLSESVSYETLRDIAGHEFAHFIDYCVNSNLGHGASFREICEVLGVENDEANLKTSLNEASKTSNVLEKIKKLLALSESSNINEAQSALLKAQKLMREYGISGEEDSSKKIYRIILTKYNNFTTEISSIIQIVKKISNCWVALFHEGGTSIAYAHGTKTECELASYLFDYLQRELAYHFNVAKKEHKLSYGAKKSFYIGVETEMMSKLRKQEAESQNNALVCYDAKNEEASKELIYKSQKFTKKSRSNEISNTGAYLSGRETGRNLRIQNGITGSNSGNSGFYLS